VQGKDFQYLILAKLQLQETKKDATNMHRSVTGSRIPNRWPTALFLFR
jgi:hypothetical protein